MEIGCRPRIRQLVTLHPGVHLRQLQRLLGVSFSSTRYHVQKMTRQGEIARMEDGRYSRLFPAGIESGDAKAFSSIRRESDSRILSNLLRERTASQKRLCELTGLARSTVSERLSELVAQDLIKIAPTANSRASYELIDPVRIRGLLEGRSGILPKASARFIELWDF